MSYKARSKDLVSVTLTAFIILLLIFSGPASAVQVSLTADKTSVQAGDSTSNMITFNVTVKILSPDRYVPMQYIVLNLTGPQNRSWAFHLDGTVFAGNLFANELTVTPAGTLGPLMQGYGYGYDYGYGAYPAGYYNFGYGYGYGNATNVPLTKTYTITLNTSRMFDGNYTAQAFVMTNNGNLPYFSSNTYNFEITPRVVTITVQSIPANTTNSSGLIQTPVGTFEYVISTNGTTIPVTINVTISVNPPSGATTLTGGGVIPDIYWNISVNDTTWYTNISVVQVRLYYNESDIPSGVSESTLRPYRFTNGTWVRLDCSSLGGCPYTLADGTVLYASGVNTSGNYAWANLSHFSVYGIGGQVTPAAAAPTGGIYSPSVVKTGLSKITISQASIRDLIYQFFYTVKQFFVVPKELAGALGALDYMPTIEDFKEIIDKITWKPVQELKGDIYEIASEKALEKYKKADVAVIARGDTEYPHKGVDSMAAVAYATARNAPILLVAPDELPEITKDTLTKLGVKEVVIVGGDKAVSEEVASQLPSPSRIWGSNRYSTAVKVAEALMDIQEVDTVVITDGIDPDVHAVMIATKYKAPVIYVAGDKLPEITKKFLEENKDSIKRVVTVGVSDKAAEEIESIVK